MDWVKRNLVFVIGGAVALVLLSLSGYYLLSNSEKNNAAREKLEAEYNELQRLSNLKPHPGKGNVDNIRRAKEQQAALRKMMKQARTEFKQIPPLPKSPKVTGEEFSAALRRTLDQLTRLAANQSVMLPTNYSFSFEAEKRLVKFAPGSLDRLAIQLGEVKVISEILCAARVNNLIGLRRERVSADDYKGPPGDYVSEASITNELGVISPYEITFESFSAELAEVMTGFANSPYGLVISGINVRPATATAVTSPYGYGYADPYGETGNMGYSGYAPTTPVYTAPAPVYTAPAYTPAAPMPGGYDDGYGGGGGVGAIRQPTFRRPTFNTGGGVGGVDAYGESMYGGPPQTRYGGNTYGQPAPTYGAPTYGAPAYGAPAYGAAAPASQTLIDEQPLSVTLAVKVIKLLPLPQE